MPFFTNFFALGQTASEPPEAVFRDLTRRAAEGHIPTDPYRVYPLEDHSQERPAGYFPQASLREYQGDNPNYQLAFAVASKEVNKVVKTAQSALEVARPKGIQSSDATAKWGRGITLLLRSHPSHSNRDKEQANRIVEQTATPLAQAKFQGTPLNHRATTHLASIEQVISTFHNEGQGLIFSDKQSTRS